MIAVIISLIAVLQAGAPNGRTLPVGVEAGAPNGRTVPVGVAAPVAQRLVGSWELVKYDIIAADGTRRPGNYENGQITYDASGRMSAHLMTANKGEHRYLGYYGPFVVEEARGIVTHIVDGSSNASWVGSRQVRYYELSSDNSQLTLSLRDAAGRTTQSLVWKRSIVK